MPVLDRRAIGKMDIDEIATFHAKVKEYLDKVEADERRRLQIEADNVRRGRHRD